MAEMTNMGNYILTVTLNPAVDKTIQINNFTLGLEHRYKQVYLSAGGKGVNVSQALQKFHVKTTATGFLGGPSGKFIQEKLREDHISCDFVWIKGETRTSLTVVDPKTRKTTRLLEQGPIVQKKEMAAFLKKFSSLVKRSSYVVLSGRNVPGAKDDFYQQLILMAKSQNKKVVLDTSALPLLLGLKAKPFFIKPNVKEAEFILQTTLSKLPEFKAALGNLVGMGIPYVIISLGSHGAVGSNGREFWSAKPPFKKAINPVGSGDALIAGFLYSLAKGYGFSKALKIAVAAGTANSLSINPGEFTRSEIVQLVRKIKLTKL